MTFAIGHSGTHAGWKKPMGNAKREPWTCECVYTADEGTSSYVLQDPRLTRCGTCGVKRP